MRNRDFFMKGKTAAERAVAFLYTNMIIYMYHCKKEKEKWSYISVNSA